MSGVYVVRRNPNTGEDVALLVVHGKKNERIACTGYGCAYCNEGNNVQPASAALNVSTSETERAGSA